jgi:hypothetical protein
MIEWLDLANMAISTSRKPLEKNITEEESAVEI